LVVQLTTVQTAH